MTAPPTRRLAPALPLLRTFEAVGRHGSFSRAAAELNVTASAVSQQMLLLEARLGVELFVRGARGVRLSPPAIRLAADVATALGGLDRAVARLDQQEADGPLEISTLASFAVEWLSPRLVSFRRRHPAVDPRVRAEQRAVDLRSREADVAIRFGSGDYPGLWSELLMTDQVYPVCAPSLAAGRAPTDLATLMAATPLIHDEGVGPEDASLGWDKWAREREVRPVGPGLRFGDALLALRAALQGEGLMLGRASIVDRYLADGRLVRPVADARPTEGAYYLVAAPPGPRGAALAFCGWIKQAAAKGAAPAPTGR